MKPRLLAEAEDELYEAVLFYDDRQPGLGYDFHAAVDTVIARIGDDAFSFPLYELKELRREYRRAMIPRFPYIVVYEIRPEEVVVVAVAHTSRDAGYWDDR